MTDYLHLSALVLLTVILVLTVRRHSDAIAAVLALAGCCVCGVLLCTLAQPVLSFVIQLAEAACLEQPMLSALLKTVGVGLLTQFSSDVCADAGQTALAKIAQTGGTVLCICISIPLLQAVLTLVQTMIGG